MAQSGHRRGQCICLLLAQSGHQPYALHPHRNPADQLGLPVKNSIKSSEGIVVNLVNGSAVAQAKRSRSRFDKFEGRLFGPCLIFKNRVFLSLIVNELEFVYLARFPAFHRRLSGIL